MAHRERRCAEPRDRRHGVAVAPTALTAPTPGLAPAALTTPPSRQPLLGQILVPLGAALALLPFVSTGVSLLAGAAVALTAGNPFVARTRRLDKVAAAVGAYIAAGYFFTSSTSFANPAISVGRMFSDTFAGIAPSAVPGFIVAQLVGGAVAIAIIRALYPVSFAAGLSSADHLR